MKLTVVFMAVNVKINKMASAKLMPDMENTRMTSDRNTTGMTVRYEIAGILCAFFLMLVLLITSVEIVAYKTPGYYEKEYTKYHVLDDLPEMTMDDLLTVTEEMMAYLRGNRDHLHVFTTMGGEYREFFNAREIAHMEDVRKLFIGGLWIRRIGLLFTACCMLVFWIQGRKSEDRKQRLKTLVPGSLCLGTGLFFAAALVIAGIISTDFSRYFVVFHHIFFDNDLWILDPRTDMLINIVPEPFFMDTALRIGIVFAVLVLLFFGLNLFFWLRAKKLRPKKMVCFLLCTVLLCGTVCSSNAYAAPSWPSDVDIAADGGIVIDVGSGAVLSGKNIHEPYYPASITKILTALVIIKHCDLNDTVTFSNSAVNTLEPGASILGARAGDQMSVRDCLYALLLQSANEVANALAEHCSGSIEAFAELMNEEARALGCTDSHFANPSGLNDENHYTSAYDMALIARAAFQNPTFVEIDSTIYYDVPPGQLKQYPDGWRYYAHHRMMRKSDSLYYEGIIGGKTGYTSLAGNTLVTCAAQNGLTLIAVVLNGHQTHYSDTKALLDFGFRNFRSVSIADMDDSSRKLENDLSLGGIAPGQSTRLSVDKNSAIILPVDADFSDVTSTMDYSPADSAPEGTIARIDYRYGDRLVGQAFLQASTVPVYTLPEVQDQDGQAAASDNSMVSAGNEETAGTQDSAKVPGITETQTAQPDKADHSPVFSILIRVVSVLAIIGIIGAAVFGILMYREYREQNERLLRRERREKRMKEWGYSSTEFDLIMQEHLRSRNRFKKRSFMDRIHDRFRR